MSRLKLIFQDNDQVEVHYEKKQIRLRTTELIPFLKKYVKNPYFIEFSFTSTKNIPLLLNLIKTLPPQCIGVDLANLVGDNLFQEIPQFFAALPAHVTHIMLDHVFNDKLIPLLKQIAQNQKEETLLPRLKTKLSEIFSALPPSISYLSLRGNAFSEHLDVLYSIVNAVTQVQSLDLRDNRWYELNAESWPEVMHNLSGAYSEIAIDFNYPGGVVFDRMIPKRQQMIASLTHRLKSIALNMRDFNDLNTPSDVLNHIPNKIKTLHWIIPTAEEDIQNPIINIPLADIFRATPAWIDTITISNYPLDSLNKELLLQFTEALRALPPHVTVFKLEEDRLSHLSIQDLTQLIAAIPSHVESVGLRGNRLFQYRSLQERDQLLTALGDYNYEGRLDLEDNGEDEIRRIPGPLRTMVGAETITHDVANLISEKINPRYANFFTPKSKDNKTDDTQNTKDNKYSS